MTFLRKLFLFTSFWVLLTSCSDTVQFENLTSKERFDKVMEQSADLCIKGYGVTSPNTELCN